MKKALGIIFIIISCLFIAYSVPIIAECTQKYREVSTTTFTVVTEVAENGAFYTQMVPQDSESKWLNFGLINLFIPVLFVILTVIMIFSRKIPNIMKYIGIIVFFLAEVIMGMIWGAH